MQPGDLYWFNDCYGSKGAVSHTPDQVFVAPVYAEGELVAFTHSWAHFNDVGGMRPGSLSPDCTDIFQEGIIVPPIRLARDGAFNIEAMRIFCRNSRFPEMVQGDMRATVAAMRLGERRLVELFERFGKARMLDAFRQLIARSAAAVREKLRALIPPGTYSFTDIVDSDGQGNGPLRLRFTLDVGDNGVIFDARDSDDQTKGPVNFLMHPAVPATILSSYLLGGNAEYLVNAGALRVIDEVKLRPGSFLQPKFPAPLGMRGVTHDAQHRGLSRPAQCRDRRPGAGIAQRLRHLVHPRPQRRGRAVSACRTASASAMARGRSPTASTRSISWRRRIFRRSFSTPPIRCVSAAMRSIPIPADPGAGAAAAALCARSRCLAPEAVVSMRIDAVGQSALGRQPAAKARALGAA